MQVELVTTARTLSTSDVGRDAGPRVTPLIQAGRLRGTNSFAECETDERPDRDVGNRVRDGPE